MSRHVDLMDADGFWRQYPVPISFDQPCEVTGAVLELLEYKNPAGERFPKLRILRDDQTVAIVICSQARLLALLCEAKPAVGDRVRIRYIGEGERAAFGLNKTKEFTVDVRRKGSRSQQRPDSETSGEVTASENAVGTGANSSD